MNKLYKNRSIIMIALLAIIIIVIMAVTAGNRTEMSGIESLTGSIIKPATGLVMGLANFMRSTITNIAELGSLRETNKRLNQQIITLKAQVRELEALRQENQRLREMLDFKNSHSQFKLIGASIIGKDPNNIFSIFTVDKGLSNGVRKNMPVITSKGLVGQVMEVGDTWAKVLPICDQRSSVSIIINRTRDAGILKGSIDARLIGQISPEAAVVEGDDVITSGMGGIYPKGLFIGKVSYISTESIQLLREIWVEPAVDFQKLEEVFIIDHDTVLPEEGEGNN